MKNSLMMNFSVDKEKKKIKVEREFAAPVSKVWAAWTESKLLEQWWAPKPWKAKTKSMDFKVGGTWLYAMVSPEGQEHWSRVDYKAITPQQSFTAKDAFCDPDGNPNPQFPSSVWTNVFKESAGHTVVSIEIEHQSLESLETIMNMGFEGGFAMGLGNLDELLLTM